MKKEIVAQKNIRQFTEEERKAMGTRIREAREEAGMKQIDLATLLAIGKNQMYRIESGLTPCKTEYLFEISQILSSYFPAWHAHMALILLRLLSHWMAGADLLSSCCFCCDLC